MKYLYCLLVLFCFSLSTHCTYQVSTLKLINSVSFGPGFTEHEQQVIMKGLNVWTRDTKGRVEFLPNSGGPDILILKGTEEQAVKRDKEANAHLKPGENPFYVVGLSYPDNGLLYMFMDRLNGNDDAILQTAAHEGGHQIGMVHVPQEEEALMDPSLNTDLLGNTHLTNYDINQFCDYWGCENKDPSKPLVK